MDKYIGRVLADRYEILELIGIGGMSYVYRAQDRKENRVVAVKILKDEFLANEEFIRRFRNESKAIALLSHPNIVKIYDVLFGEYLQIIVMEYIDGITLKEYIEHQKALKWKEAVHFTVQILRALQHAHDKGIVHRDIKPQNIMLLQDGTIKVMDFGIARFARSDPQTMTDKAIGSVHYISPEQARGERINEKTDIYSVGVMLFEMLTGVLPFQGDSPVTVALMQIQELPQKPREINPNVPQGLEYITLHAMQKDQQRRYQSAAEMLRDLDTFKRNPAIRFAEEEVEQIDEQQTRQFEVPDLEYIGDIEEPWEKKSAVIPVLAGVAFAFIVSTLLFVIGILYINNPFEAVDDFTMPKLIGMSYEEAVAMYSDLDIIVTERGYSEQYAKGQIYDQNPREGRSVKENAMITVSVSEGIRIIELPDLVDLDGELAEKTLLDYDLVPILTEEPSDTVTAGMVIRTNPEPHTELRPGDAVELIVSIGNGSQKSKVPLITGMRVSDAIRILGNEGLKIGDQRIEASDQPAGIIVEQTIAAQTEVDRGTAISVVVSDGSLAEGSGDPVNPGDLVKLTLPIPLPTQDLPSSYVLSVVEDQKILFRETIYADNYPEENKIRIALEDVGTKEYIVLINGYAYLTIEVYFDDITYSIVKGQSGVFDFTEAGIG